MKKPLFALLAIYVALAATLATGELHQRTGSWYITYHDARIGYDSMAVTVGGWPWPYLYDQPLRTPVGSVSNLMGLRGRDDFRVVPFLRDYVFFALCFLTLLVFVPDRYRQLRTSAPPAE